VSPFLSLDLSWPLLTSLLTSLDLFLFTLHLSTDLVERSSEPMQVSTLVHVSDLVLRSLFTCLSLMRTHSCLHAHAHY
jgi:hypothetical protein